MCEEVTRLHCKVLALRQDSALRQNHFAEEGDQHLYLSERLVGLELERVLQLFETVGKKESVNV